MLGRVVGGTVVAVLALAEAARAQAAPGALPPGVTAQMVKEGETLYKGAGLCSACHGPDGKGIPSLGADLTDGKWIHSKGSYDEIVKQIIAGVTADKSTTGVVMPPKGGTTITDAQVKAIAAYVWTLSHQAKK
jgi:mono/diheme cytochrome c family protein